MPILSGRENPRPGQPRPGSGVFDSSQAFSLLPGYTGQFYVPEEEPPYLAGGVLVGPNRYVFVTSTSARLHPKAGSGYTQTDLGVIAAVGWENGQFKWRTVVYVPFASINGNLASLLTASVTPSGNLMLSGNAVYTLGEGSGSSKYRFLTLELAPDGTLARNPSWHPNTEHPMTTIFPLSGGGWYTHHFFDQRLVFYDAAGHVLRRLERLD
jgi:hypothetical protein